jgi:transcriptional regulator with XRE-family HTH domain
MKNSRLVALRGSKTMQEVADLIGIPKSTYANIECGRRMGNPKTMHKIAKFFNRPIEHLFFVDAEEEREKVEI